MISYKEELTREDFISRIKKFTINECDITNEVSYILDNYDQMNDAELQFNCLQFLKKVSDIDDIKTINALLNFPLIDFLLTHFKSSIFEKEKEILIEIIGSLLKNSKDLKTEDLLSFFLSQLSSIRSSEEGNHDLLYHILYAIYQFFSNKYLEIFEKNDFLRQLFQLFNLSPEIDMLLLQFSLKFAKSFQFTEEISEFILHSIKFHSDDTVDIISYIIYSVFKRDPTILKNDFIKDTIVECFCNSNNHVSQKYALKLFAHLQENNIYFLEYDPSIITTIFSIIESTDHQRNHPLLKFSIPVIYRTLQLSLPLAESLFFNEKNNLTLFISDIILDNCYELRNLGIKVFSLLMKNLPSQIYIFLDNPELTKILFEIFTIVFDIDENEDSLSIFLTSVEKYLDVLSNESDQNRLFNFSLILQSEEIKEKINDLSLSENEEVTDTFQVISEKLLNLIDKLST